MSRSVPRRVYIAVALPALALLAFVALQPWMPHPQAFRDVQNAALRAGPGEPVPLLGLVSNVGVLLWWLAACCAGFGAALAFTRAGVRAAVFPAALALFSAALMADDFFLLHELVYPGLGLSEKRTFALYGATLVVILAIFRRAAGEAGWGLVGTVVVLQLGAGLADLTDGVVFTGLLQRWLEDGLKFLGIAFWAAFVVRAAWQAANVAPDPDLPPGP